MTDSIIGGCVEAFSLECVVFIPALNAGCRQFDRPISFRTAMGRTTGCFERKCLARGSDL